jgi:hypothetical protein
MTRESVAPRTNFAHLEAQDEQLAQLVDMTPAALQSLIAQGESETLCASHPTRAIETWGRGTNRVVEACRTCGIAKPMFTEASGASP